jgi:hypothetical protein
VCFVLDDELLIVIDMGGVLLISLVFFFERLVEPHMLHISPDEKKLLNSDSQLCSEIYNIYVYIYIHIYARYLIIRDLSSRSNQRIDRASVPRVMCCLSLVTELVVLYND